VNVEQRHDLQIGEAIRRALNEGNRAIYLVKDGNRWQVSVKRPDATSFGVEIGTDPIETLWRACVPFRDRISDSSVKVVTKTPEKDTSWRLSARSWNGVRDLFHPLD